MAMQRVDEHLGDLRDYRTFAAHSIRTWWKRNHQGADIAPQDIALTIRSFHGVDLPVRHSNLLDWVISGGYSAYDERGYRLQAEAAEPERQEPMTHALMQKMINELDLRLAYRQALLRALGQEPVKAALGEAAIARLSLALAGARHADEASIYDLISRLLAGELAVEGLTVYRVQLNGISLSGIFCFAHGNDFVLYAPGAPGGDLRRFAPQIALQAGLVNLLATPSGMAYLMSRVPVTQRPKLENDLSRLESPTWYPGIVGLRSLEQSRLRVAMVGALRQAQYDALRLATPKWYAESAHQDRERLASLENELAQVQAAHAAQCTVPRLLDFARSSAARKINEYPGNPGRWIDPDTVMISGSEGDLSFTQWMAWGYPTGFNFDEFSQVRSSIGQDLSHLTLLQLGSAIRAFSSDVRRQYKNHVTAGFLDEARADGDLQERLHRTLMGLKVRRDFLVASLRGYLSAEQAKWLKKVSETAADDDILGKHFFERLAFTQGLNRIVEGAYLLSNTPGDQLVYVCDAANGRAVRTLRDIAESWHEENLGAFFTSRVASFDKAAMRELTRLRGRDPQGSDVVYNARSHSGQVEDWAHDLRLRAEHRIWDAERQTTSVQDRVLESLEHITLPVVGAGATLIGTLGMPLILIAATVNLVQASLGFARGANAWWDGDRGGAVVSFAIAGIGVAAASGLAKALGHAWSLLSPGPASLFGSFLKEIVLVWGPKSAGPTGKLFQDELLGLLKAQDIA